MIEDLQPPEQPDEQDYSSYESTEEDLDDLNSDSEFQVKTKPVMTKAARLDALMEKKRFGE